MKKLYVGSFLVVIFFLIVYLFWRQEVQYWTPTDVPENYSEVKEGSSIDLSFVKPGNKVFLHFFNPNCPCTKFNFESYKKLVKDYNSEFDKYVVIQSTDDGLSDEQKEVFQTLNVKVIIDQKKSIAKTVGVYATPQIVLLDEDNKLFYRGNYNASRYCTNPATNYAEQAIEQLIKGEKSDLPKKANTAYGCDLNRKTN